MAVTLSSANIWSLWSGHGGQGAARFSRRRCRWLAGRHSLWPRWFPAPRLMTRRQQPTTAATATWRASTAVASASGRPPRAMLWSPTDKPPFPQNGAFTG